MAGLRQRSFDSMLKIEKTPMVVPYFCNYQVDPSFQTLNHCSTVWDNGTNLNGAVNSYFFDANKTSVTQQPHTTWSSSRYDFGYAPGEPIFEPEVLPNTGHSDTIQVEPSTSACVPNIYGVYPLRKCKPPKKNLKYLQQCHHQQQQHHQLQLLHQRLAVEQNLTNIGPLPGIAPRRANCMFGKTMFSETVNEEQGCSLSAQPKTVHYRSPYLNNNRDYYLDFDEITQMKKVIDSLLPMQKLSPTTTPPTTTSFTPEMTNYYGKNMSTVLTAESSHFNTGRRRNINSDTVFLKKTSENSSRQRNGGGLLKTLSDAVNLAVSTVGSYQDLNLSAEWFWLRRYLSTHWTVQWVRPSQVCLNHLNHHQKRNQNHCEIRGIHFKINDCSAQIFHSQQTKERS